ncbi:hypothetical protein ACFFV7_53335 [Nonomuraea spiralis]|uniref:Uncharacterized protein n=1 Tax=Nonomuraea spiralis TaxID=46182 RepID=A0ABV5IZP8_9ACTN|nr:hypothetical protein [Nonomuraea spiralis]
MIVETAVVHEIDAETIISPTATGQLLLDSSDTGGALSTIRMTLADGADGAVPHHHATTPPRPSCSTSWTAGRASWQARRS